MSYQDIPGWSDDILPFYADISRALPKGAKFAEVGCFLGRSLAFMGELRPDLELFAVDPWEDWESQGYEGTGEFTSYVRQFGSLFEAFLGSMLQHSRGVLRRTHIVRLRSDVGIHALPFDLDMIFIDGAHNLESVQMDIANAKMYCTKPGSIIAGHDYAPRFPGVMGAVAEAFGPDDFKVMGTCWFHVVSER